jgi:hypothetical protein
VQKYKVVYEKHAKNKLYGDFKDVVHGAGRRPVHAADA